MTAIIDYKAGNLTSVKLAFAALGAETLVTSDPRAIAAADRVVFPGVGAARSAMENLKAFGLVDAVKDGMQILFDHSEEDGGVECLGIIPGRVRRFPSVPGFKVPEIGWNGVEGLDGKEFYFVHSYYAEVVPETTGVAEYAGVRFTAMVRKDRLWACQFHPEKSGRIGLELLKEWLSC